jgi:thioredoxin-like negative regulator of GroEL
MAETALTEQEIEAWATNPANKQRAIELAKRLIAHQTNHAGLTRLPSLGSFEDRATAWAIENPTRTRTLMMRLAPRLMR